jgi:MscS family membrane protein
VRLILVAVAMRSLALMSDSLLGRQFWSDTAGVIAVIGCAWLIMVFTDIVFESAEQRLLRKQKPEKLAMMELSRRLLKILVALVAGVVLLHRTGVNVTAMLAELGVSGIALALAAQKTLENLFGGMSVIMQETIRVGDVCKIAGQTGTVEDIGLSATRRRTLDRSVVSVPNAQLSQLSLENLSLRDKGWFHQTFGLQYDLSPNQMRAILSGIDRVLRNSEEVEPSTARVRFIGFGPASMSFEIFAYTRESNYEVFLRVQETLLLAVMDVVDAAGVGFVGAPLVPPDRAKKMDPHMEGDVKLPVVKA